MIDTYNFHGNRLEFSLVESISAAGQKLTFHFLNLIRLNLRQQLRYLFKKTKDASVRESRNGWWSESPTFSGFVITEWRSRM